MKAHSERGKVLSRCTFWRFLLSNVVLTVYWAKHEGYYWKSKKWLSVLWETAYTTNIISQWEPGWFIEVEAATRWTYPKIRRRPPPSLPNWLIQRFTWVKVFSQSTFSYGSLLVVFWYPYPSKVWKVTWFDLFIIFILRKCSGLYTR